jgi:hypothetical protein
VTWAKLSDDFSDDCWELSSDAYRLHVEGLNWTMRKLTAGVLLKAEMMRWAKFPNAADELVARGYWTDEGDRYTIRHHMGYQPEPEKVLKRQDANRLNGMKGGRPRGADIKPPKTHSVSDSVSEQVSQTVLEPEHPATKPQEKTQSLTQSKTHKDGTGRDGKTNGGNEKNDEDYAADLRAWYAEGASTSQRIEANIRAGYES